MRDVRLTGFGFGLFVATLSALTVAAGVGLDSETDVAIEVPSRRVALPLTSVPSIEIAPLVRPLGRVELISGELGDFDDDTARGSDGRDDGSFIGVPAPVPWPAAMSVLGMAGMSIGRGRRRRVS